MYEMNGALNIGRNPNRAGAYISMYAMPRDAMESIQSLAHYIGDASLLT